MLDLKAVYKDLGGGKIVKRKRPHDIARTNYQAQILPYDLNVTE